MKYVTLISLLCLLLIFQFLPAQAPDTLWTKTFGGYVVWDEGRSVKQTTDGGYIISGYTYEAVWLIKTNSTGDTLWTKTFGGSYGDCGYSVQETTDGGYIIAGKTSSYGAGNEDVWLIRTDSQGDTLWTKTYGGSSLDGGYSIQQTTDGGYIITGYTYSFGVSTDEDVWLIKTDSHGDTLWTKTFGGSYGDCGYSVQETTDGGYIIAGKTSSYGAGNEDVWLIRTDSQGDTLWTKTYGGSSLDGGYSIQQTTDGGYIITGYTYSFGFGFPPNVWLLKIDNIGDTLWTKTFGGNYNDVGYSVQETTDRGCIITGMTRFFGASTFEDVWLIRTDSQGDTLWTKTFGTMSNDAGYSVQQTTDGGYIITGYTYSYGVGFSPNVWLIKTTPDPMNIREQENILFLDYCLPQNYPNPFNPTTTIAFDLPKTSQVTLKVFNILGEEVVTLVSDRLSAGSYSYEWDARELASGIYLYKLHASDYVETRKMVLMR